MSNSDLFDPVALGCYVLANRIVMAPLPRSRATLEGVPTAMMADYYGQRASAGLIIAEGTNISSTARGYAFTPGLYDPIQVDGWRNVTEAVHLAACGSQRMGIRLSPVSPVNDCAVDSNPTATYGYLVEQTNQMNLAYLHIIEGVTQGARSTPVDFDFQTLRRAIRTSYIANNGYDLNLAMEARRKDLADLVSFGRTYIANPDLVIRLRQGVPLNTPDRSTFFGGGERGYTDYPTLDDLHPSRRSVYRVTASDAGR